jgi:hypothetical protein
MSSLADLARGGAVDSGTNPTSTGSPGSPRDGASASLLPHIGPTGSIGAVGVSGEARGMLNNPSLTAGGLRSNAMSTPRQLDRFMHDVEGNMDDMTAEDWHDTAESTIGSMGGESNKGVVKVYVVVKGAGIDFCCGPIGANSARFCTSHPNECGYKSHVDKKAGVMPGHVYLGSEAGKKNSGWVSWCMPIKVFGGKENQLSALGLNGPQFRRFGETLLGIQSGGKVDMAHVSWDPILKEIKQPLNYGGTPRKVQFRKQDQDAIESTGLSNWMTLDTPGSEIGGGEEGMDPSVEDDFLQIEKLTNVTANAEVLKSAIEQLNSNQGKSSSELGEVISSLSAQIHDVSVRLGNNPGFVGSPHDSAWNGITDVYDKIEASERLYETRTSRLVADSLRSSVQTEFELQLAGGHMQGIIAQEVKRATEQAQAQIHDMTSTVIKDLQVKNQALQDKTQKLEADVRALKLNAPKALPNDFGEDWKLVFEFFVRNTIAANPPRVGGKLEAAVSKNSLDIADLASGVSNDSSASLPAGNSFARKFTLGSAPSGPSPSTGMLATLQTQVLDLQARLESKAVSIDDYTFPTLSGTSKWAVANLPSSPEKALICVDVVTLLHSIGREFATTDETRDTIYQNKRAGVSSMAITVSSSFQTVLPQIMGKSSRTSGEDSGLTLPCASKYTEWFDNSEGIPTGTKPRIQEGLATQKAVYEEAIRELAYTHPVGAAMASKLLQRSFDFATLLLGMIDTMWNEYASRSGEIQPSEAWLVICAVVRQLFREFRNVRRPGAAVVPGTQASVGTTWWYVLQTHRIMDEFAAVDIRRHHSIIPVFTSHLDRHRVTKSSHATLVNQVKKMEVLVGTLNTSVNKINGARGNAGGRGGRGGQADDG